MTNEGKTQFSVSRLRAMPALGSVVAITSACHRIPIETCMVVGGGRGFRRAAKVVGHPLPQRFGKSFALSNRCVVFNAG